MVFPGALPTVLKSLVKPRLDFSRRWICVLETGTDSSMGPMSSGR